MGPPTPQASQRAGTVSVAICLHNGSTYISRALSSVFAQTWQDFEIVLVDDGSIDGGADLVETHFKDPRLRIFRQPNRGLGAARSVTVAAAAGEFIAFLDQDDEWLPEKLAGQVELLRRRPRAGLVFTDCAYIDESGRETGRASARVGHDTIDFRGRKAVRALLTRGCFIDISSVMVRAAAIGEAGGFNSRWRYVEDYDLWLRVAKLYELEYLASPLTRRRLHAGQFTQRHHGRALTEESALLRPILLNGTCPPDVKRAIRHYLFGQHTARATALMRGWRVGPAARALAGGARYPAALGLRVLAEVGSRIPRVRALKRRLAAGWVSARPEVRSPPSAVHVWMDGSPLQAARGGCFNLTAELIRALAATPGCHVHVEPAASTGRPAWLRRCLHAGVHLVTSLGEVRIRPRRNPRSDLVELISWRGRFRLPGATRIALLPDLTPRLRPDLHTPEAIRDFERFVAHAMRHAHVLVTISEHSRRDILRLLPAFPERVHVIPVPVNPRYHTPSCTPQVLRRYSIQGRYVLCVATREPRKNLRRMVDAFSAATGQGLDHDLVLAGPAGWDTGFDEWLRAHPATSRVRALGFVPDDDLPSLYRLADAVIYPSLYEGFGLPVLEAMSCSGLVLASSVSSLPEVLGPGGRYFNPASEEDITRAIVEALRLSPEDQQRYRAYGRERAESLRHRAVHGPVLPGLPRAS